MGLRSIFTVAFALVDPSRPLAPAWSPNGQILASTKVPEQFVTPEGGNYKLLMNGKLVYPAKVPHGWFSAYKDQHTFLSPLVWSPNSQDVAFLEKVYDWEYYDPYNFYWEGRASKLRYYLAIVSADGRAFGYRLTQVPDDIELEWRGPEQLELDGRTLNLQTNPPQPIK